MEVSKVYDLPIKTFWLMEHNINRLRAEADLRQLRLSTADKTSDGVKELSQQLARELGSVVIASEQREERATERLKGLAARLNG